MRVIHSPRTVSVEKFNVDGKFGETYLKLVPVFWYWFLSPISGMCVVGISHSCVAFLPKESFVI